MTILPLPTEPTEFLTKVTVFHRVGDGGSLREATDYSIYLVREDFDSLAALKGAIRERTRAGFLRSQFFQVAFRAQYFEGSAQQRDEQEAFLTTDSAVYEAGANLGDPPLDIMVVRYTKVQAGRLRSRVQLDEQRELNELLATKRRYDRRQERERARDAGIDANTSISSGDYQGYPDLTSPHPDEEFLNTVAALGTDQIVCALKTYCAFGSLYSEPALRTWADAFRDGQHRSLSLPPPCLPLPILRPACLWHEVVVPANLRAICMLFASYLVRQTASCDDNSEDDHSAE
ncbi:hypothetical protein GMRT_14926 [Giardia muris]|uniref:Uncharacterized protein n=1 Tax=Giardia muris TaxID=5742 RepID=A0A4Z1SPI6_GIAMU|nr:hypothetical protein GMRT_14926 [Giardia muris]|eukprot:TNJ27732.1 hypothetical protein GMRT_14926 [Giardia muris]